MKIFLFHILLIMSFPWITNAQNVIKVIPGYVTIESKLLHVEENDTLIIQRIVNDNVIDIGKVNILKLGENKVAAKISDEYDPYHIQEGDFVKGFSPQGYINDIDDTIMAELLSQRNSGQVQTQSDNREIRLIKRRETRKDSIINRWRVNFEYGYSYRTAKVSDDIPSEFKSYINKLKSGSNFNLDISYFISNMYGIGFKYSIFQSSNRMGDLLMIDENTGNILAVGSMEDNISVSLIGPSFVERHFASKNKIIVIANVMLGLLSYKNDSELFDIPISIDGSSIGFNGSLGIDYLFSSHWALGVSLSYTTGSLNKLTIDGYETELSEPENLSRIDINGGIKFVF